MKSTTKWVKNYQSVVDNGRSHGIVIDLPEGKDGDDMGPTALELAVMGLSGCIGTIYSLIAKKMRLSIDSIEVELEAEKGPDDPTVTKVSADVKVKSSEKKAKLEKCLETTMNTCPVGVLYQNAGIPMDINLHVVE
ncbi:MAG: OsmC family peroxiredoxin [Candidatus Heimdallarchaeota archaeon]|nr:OsmC family peroxiredoxin [Candidatus Heimdallarchaeota archaeon]